MYKLKRESFSENVACKRCGADAYLHLSKDNKREVCSKCNYEEIDGIEQSTLSGSFLEPTKTISIPKYFGVLAKDSFEEFTEKEQKEIDINKIIILTNLKKLISLCKEEILALDGLNETNKRLNSYEEYQEFIKERGSLSKYLEVSFSLGLGEDLIRKLSEEELEEEMISIAQSDAEFLCRYKTINIDEGQNSEIELINTLESFKADNVNKFESYLAYYDETAKEIKTLIERDCYIAPLDELAKILDGTSDKNEFFNIEKIEKSLEPMLSKVENVLSDMKGKYSNKKAEMKSKKAEDAKKEASSETKKVNLEKSEEVSEKESNE